jgi:dihydroorotate dehydrogenase (fumarate)
MKSIFEEEIISEMKNNLVEMTRPACMYPEIYEMFDFSTEEDSVTKYLELINNAKNEISVPLIASVNCISADEWPVFAKRIESAGADAIELNAFILPTDMNRTSAESESVYFDIINNVKKEVKIPVALKMSYYFSNLGQMIAKLSSSGVDALVLFNRFYSPDIDIENMAIVPASTYSTAEELPISLRWMAIMAGRVDCDLSASTGIHDGKAAIKQILAGAKTVQIASVLYRHGVKIVPEMLKEMNEWMDRKGFATLENFRAMMCIDEALDPAAWERSQFMKHYSLSKMQN